MYGGTNLSNESSLGIEEVNEGLGALVERKGVKQDSEHHAQQSMQLVVVVDNLQNCKRN